MQTSFWKLILAIACLVIGVRDSVAEELVRSPAMTRPERLRMEIHGTVGDYTERVVEQWLLKAPKQNPAMLQMLADRENAKRDLLPWSGEFAGKYLTGATQVLRVTDRPDLKTLLRTFTAELIAKQADNGYLGPFPKEFELTGKAPQVKGSGTWDAWGHYHMMVGLLLWHDETGDAEALAAARRIGELLCDKFLPDNRTVVATGSAEMNQAVAHSMAILYRYTGDKRHLQLAEKLVAEFAADGAGDYLRAALAGKEFFQTPKPRWESLHPIMALAELYWITGKPEYRTAYENLWWSIAKLDRHNNGGFSSGEQAQGNPYDPGAIETCCTIAWMAMSVEMLRMTGDPIVADELELSTLNQIVGLHAPSGEWCTYNTPMDGRRIPSTEDIAFQIRPGSEQLNCCSVNAARGFGLLSEWSLMQMDDGLALNWFGPGKLKTAVDGKQVMLEQKTDYPRNGHVELRIDCEEPATFCLKLRIPHWSQQTTAAINGESLVAKAGEYLAVKREWKTGDQITLEFDMAPRFWSGERNCEGKACVYHGPILLATEDETGEKYDRHWLNFAPLHATKERGAVVEFPFEGDLVKWVGFYFDDAGKSRVAIDGREVAVVDQYGPKRDVPFTWEHKGLGAGPHLLRLETLGEKSAESKDTWANVLRFEPVAETAAIDAAALKLELRNDSPADALLFDAADGKGKTLRLRDYASAGQDRMAYRTWLHIENAPVAAFSKQNPSRTSPAATR